MRTLFEDRPSRAEHVATWVRRHPFMTLGLAGLIGACFASLFVWQAIASWRQYDPAFDTRLARPAYRDGPIVLFDAGHYEVHTAATSYRPFARLLEADGYRVAEHTGRITAPSLAAARVLIVPNALGAKGVVAMVANALRVRSGLDWNTDAFDQQECDVVRQWVDRGGGLLIVSDHKPSGAAVSRLGRQFGVSFRNWYTEDAAAPNHDSVSDAWTFLVFSRANGLLRDHPITLGRDPSERVESVITFSGGSLTGPPEAAPFMKLSATARDFPTQDSPESAGRSAADAAQGLALTSGRGRVVVLGEAGMLGAYTLRRGQEYPSGMSRRDHGNRQLALNIVRWLSGAI
jgi:hypothetical protein